LDKRKVIAGFLTMFLLLMLPATAAVEGLEKDCKEETINNEYKNVGTLNKPAFCYNEQFLFFALGWVIIPPLIIVGWPLFIMYCLFCGDSQPNFSGNIDGPCMLCD